jgi:hypothetical protein
MLICLYGVALLFYKKLPTSLENSVGRMSTAKQITPSPSISSWYELVEGLYLQLYIHK